MARRKNTWRPKSVSVRTQNHQVCFVEYIAHFNAFWTSHHTCSSWLTHWGRETHICVCNLTIIDSDNGLSPFFFIIIWIKNDGLLLIGPLGTYFSKIWIKIQQFSLRKIHLNMSSGKCRPSCLGLSVLSGVSWWQMQCHCACMHHWTRVSLVLDEFEPRLMPSHYLN